MSRIDEAGEQAGPIEEAPALPDGPALSPLDYPESTPLLAARFGRLRSRRVGNGAVIVATAWVVLVVFCAVFADLLPLRDYSTLHPDLDPRLGLRLSWTEPLGTDALGRSTLSRLVFGARQSLLVGVLSSVLATVVGLTLGLLAGYLGGKVARVIDVLLDTILAVPAIVLLLAIASVGRRDVTTVVIGLSVVGVPIFSRLARANTVALASREFVKAARAMGATRTRILLREILPNVIFPVSTFTFLFMAYAIVIEGSLSFLGLGIPPPSPSWGGMINDGHKFLQSDPHLVFAPALCLVATVVAFTAIGDRVRRRFDVRESLLT